MSLGTDAPSVPAVVLSAMTSPPPNDNPSHNDEDLDPDTAPDMRRKWPKLTTEMLITAKKAVDEFACKQWQKRNNLESMLLPYMFYIPSHLQRVLFDNFHTIRSRADLADILLEWDHVDSDADIFGLFDIIRHCNEAFDKQHSAKKAQRAQKAAITRQMRSITGPMNYTAGTLIWRVPMDNFC